MISIVFHFFFRNLTRNKLSNGRKFYINQLTLRKKQLIGCKLIPIAVGIDKLNNFYPLTNPLANGLRTTISA
jgi:hypothetical protein